MVSSQPHVSIIILNWNGWRDTIECLESVLKSEYENYHVLLVDNCSQDNSPEKIKDWALDKLEHQIESALPQFVFPLIDKPTPLWELKTDGSRISGEMLKNDLSAQIPARSIVLVRNHENSGFAAGSNLGIKISDFLFPTEYIFLLNNDAVIEPQAIRILVDYLSHNKEIGAATSAIYAYTEPQKIANLGGKLTYWGTQSYFTNLNGQKIRKVSFVTGCALMVRKNVLDKFGFFSEKFFFGEEDFEFSMRLRKNNIPMACVAESRVYHKVSASSEKLYQNITRKKFIHVFNRVIDMKDYFSYPVWVAWKWLILGYSLFWLTVKHRESFSTARKFVLSLNKYTHEFDNARKATVEKIYQEIGL